MTTDLLTEQEAAVILHKGPRTIARLRKAGVLPYLPGHPVLIPRQALSDYIAANIVRTRPAQRVVRQVRLTHPRTK